MAGRNFLLKTIPSRVILLHDIESNLGAGMQPLGSRYLLKWDIVKKAILEARNDGVTFETLDKNSPYISNPDVRITIDDGGASSLEIAEQLKNLNIKGYFFITTNFIDKEGFLTKKQIYMIKTMGHELGSHGHNHATPFCELSNDELIQEVKQSQIILEEYYGQTINIFSVPGGEIRSDTLKRLKDPNLSLNEIYTSVPVQGFLSKKHSRNALIYGRLCIERNMSHSQICRYLKGSNWLYIYLDYQLRRLRREIIYKTNSLYKKILKNIYG